MVFRQFTSPFGAATRTRVLIALSLLRSSYPRELARVLGAHLNSVRKALISLELDGLVVGRSVGRTRVYEFNPSYFAREELSRFVARLAAADVQLRDRTASLRRRPRRVGKPL
jgi:DNA-binding transcriptional regulator YhcF (GntR family)